MLCSWQKSRFPSYILHKYLHYISVLVERTLGTSDLSVHFCGKIMKQILLEALLGYMGKGRWFGTARVVSPGTSPASVPWQTQWPSTEEWLHQWTREGLQMSLIWTSVMPLTWSPTQSFSFIVERLIQCVDSKVNKDLVWLLQSGRSGQLLRNLQMAPSWAVVDTPEE